MARYFIGSVEAEFRRYKALAEGAMDQLSAEDLCKTGTKSGPHNSDNSIATLVWHIAGNLRSRFTEFLGSDGEKPWRQREGEFEPRKVSRAELQAEWEDGWRVLFVSLSALSDDDLRRVVSIRRVPLEVHEALHRSLAHTSYHVGQIVYLGKMLRGPSWKYLSIPPGASEEYNRNPVFEKTADRRA